MLVTDMPLWEDCPFIERIPKPIEVRRGLNEGVDYVAFWDPVHEIHVDVEAKLLVTPNGRGKYLETILENLQFFAHNKRLLKA